MPRSKDLSGTAGDPQAAGPRSGREQFLAWFSVIGTVGTLFFGGLSVYFYEASKVGPMLTFGVHPLKMELQRPDSEKELGFTYGGMPVDSVSVTSVYVSIWNAGTRSIRDTDILSPIQLVMPEGSAILNAQVKKASRSLCEFERIEDHVDYKSGVCRLKWRILEPGDGAVVQIIYAGGARHDPKLEGAVEGQKAGFVVEEYSLALNGTSIISKGIQMTRVVPIGVLFIISLSLLFVIDRTDAKSAIGKELAGVKRAAARQVQELRKKAARSRPIWQFVLIGVVGLCMLMILAVILFPSRLGPPFGW